MGEDATAAPAAYVTRMLADAFRVTTSKFFFSKIELMRVNGVVIDQGTAFVVYSINSQEKEGFRQPYTMTFRQDQGAWKLWSLCLSKLVVDTWPEAAKPGEDAEAAGSVPGQ